MSQKTFKGFPLFSGSIQYSPSPLELAKSRICLHERPGCEEYQPGPISTFEIKNKAKLFVNSQERDQL